MISEHIDHLQVRSLSGFDSSFYRFFKADLERGVPSEEIERDLAYYFMQRKGVRRETRFPYIEFIFPMVEYCFPKIDIIFQWIEKPHYVTIKGVLHKNIRK